MKNLVGLWTTCYKNKNRTFRSLRGYLKSLDIWVAAYMKVAGNKGATTPGPDGQSLDGTTLKKLENLQKGVLAGTFEFEGARRKEIPKAGKKGTRPVAMPAASDKIVQEVLRMLLEPIFEFTFSPNSHGFRRGRSCHTALGQIDRDFKPVKWVVGGDICKYFDTVDHGILLNLIRKRVQDPLVLALIKKGLEARVFPPEGEEGERVTLGLPQGGVLSPLLSNIYLHELDAYLEAYKAQFDKGLKPKNNPEYDRAMHQKVRPPKGVLPYVYNSPAYKRVVYVRYADDFLVGVRGSIQDAMRIKYDIAQFLNTHLKITLSEEKTAISHIGSAVYFLGHKLYVKKVPAWKKSIAPSRHLGRVYRKVKQAVLCIDGDKTRVLSKLASLGMMKTKLIANKLRLIGTSYPPFLPYPQSSIIHRYNSILRGLGEWWKHAGNRRALLHHVGYILKISAAKTLAHKFKLRLSQVLALAGPQLSTPIKKASMIGLTDQRIAEWQSSVGKHTSKLPSTPPLLYTKYSDTPARVPLKHGKGWVPPFWKELEKATNPPEAVSTLLETPVGTPISFLSAIERRLTRAVKLFHAACTLCGSTTDVQMHHIRKVSAIKAKTEAERKVKAFNRKQIPLCRGCHFEVHGHNWRNPPVVPKPKPPKP